MQEEKNSIRRLEIKQYIRSLTTLPEELLKYISDVPENKEAFEKFIFLTDKYAEFCETHSGKFVNDLAPGHQHKDIHCISFLKDDDFRSIIGTPLRKFNNLFESLLPVLKIAFPRSPAVLGPSLLRMESAVDRSLFFGSNVDLLLVMTILC